MFWLSWFVCGFLSLAIAFHLDFKKCEKKYDITINKLLVGLSCIWFGYLSFVITIVFLGLEYSERVIFTIKKKGK